MPAGLGESSGHWPGQCPLSLEAQGPCRVGFNGLICPRDAQKKNPKLCVLVGKDIAVCKLRLSWQFEGKCGLIPTQRQKLGCQLADDET